MHSSMVFGMTILVDCKVYETVRIHAKVYISFICDVNDIHHTSLYMYKCDILQLICEKDTNIEHEIKHNMKKMYSIRDQYT